VFVVFIYSITIYLLRLFMPDLSMIILGLIGFVQSIIITVAVTLICFFRDPERIPPEKEKIVISPADGEIVYIKKIKKGEFPFAVKGKNHIPLSELTKEEFIKSKGYQIGIAMNFLHVHVNRAPIAGKAIKLIRIPGKFCSLKRIRSMLENERVCTIVQGDKIKVAIVQIASRLVRRIVPFIRECDTVILGQRIGMIKFGSQVDLLIPDGENVKILVKVNDEVKAGMSILATY
jgi:phosphatidylserine decarboxylase